MIYIYTMQRNKFALNIPFQSDFSFIIIHIYEKTKLTLLVLKTVASTE